MSTNHTTNYDLCQWEATDQVYAPISTPTTPSSTRRWRETGPDRDSKHQNQHRRGQDRFFGQRQRHWTGMSGSMWVCSSTTHPTSAAADTEWIACALNNTPSNSYCSYANRYISVTAPELVPAGSASPAQWRRSGRSVYLGGISGIGVGSIAYNTLDTLDFVYTAEITFDSAGGLRLRFGVSADRIRRPPAEAGGPSHSRPVRFRKIRRSELIVGRVVGISYGGHSAILIIAGEDSALQGDLIAILQVAAQGDGNLIASRSVRNGVGAAQNIDIGSLRLNVSAGQSPRSSALNTLLKVTTTV